MNTNPNIIVICKTGTTSMRQSWSDFARVNAEVIGLAPLKELFARLITHARADWNEFAIVLANASDVLPISETPASA